MLEYFVTDTAVIIFLYKINYFHNFFSSNESMQWNSAEKLFMKMMLLTFFFAIWKKKWNSDCLLLVNLYLDYENVTPTMLCLHHSFFMWSTFTIEKWFKSLKWSEKAMSFIFISFDEQKLCALFNLESMRRWSGSPNRMNCALFRIQEMDIRVIIMW